MTHSWAEIIEKNNALNQDPAKRLEYVEKLYPDIRTLTRQTKKFFEVLNYLDPASLRVFLEKNTTEVLEVFSSIRFNYLLKDIDAKNWPEFLTFIQSKQPRLLKNFYQETLRALLKSYRNTSPGDLFDSFDALKTDNLKEYFADNDDWDNKLFLYAEILPRFKEIVKSKKELTIIYQELTFSPEAITDLLTRSLDIIKQNIKSVEDLKTFCTDTTINEKTLLPIIAAELPKIISDMEELKKFVRTSKTGCTDHALSLLMSAATPTPSPVAIQPTGSCSK